MTQDIKFDETVTKRIQDRWKDGDRLLLTFEDGVGPYSQHSMIHMQTQFTINIIGPEASLDTYDATIDSNLGKVYVKAYGMEGMDDHLVVRFHPQYDTMSLSGDSGDIDTNVGFIDFTDPNGIKENPAR